jgi:hypothetical protein
MRLQLVLRFLVVLAFALLVSCSAERKLAREYVKNHVGEGVMISATDFLYKENLGAYIDASKFSTAEQQDSVAYYTSTFVQYISDSVFLSSFFNSMIGELQHYGYTVILDHSADVFLGYERPAWIIQMAQLQLEEDFAPGVAYGYNDEDEEYYQEYKVNEVSLNSWLEINRLNSDDPKQMLFLSGYISDDSSLNVSLQYFNGHFYLTNPNVTIGLNNIYDMATASGKKHAELLFDYFLNDYIRLKSPKGITHRKEFHYNWKFRKLDNQLYEKFEVVN